MHASPPRLIALTLILSLAASAQRDEALDLSLPRHEEADRKVGSSLRSFLDGRARAGGQRALQVGAKVEPGPFVRREGSGSTRRLDGISIAQMRNLSDKYNFSVDFFEVSGSFDGIVAAVGAASGVRDGATGGMRPIDVSVQLFTATGVRSLTARQTASPIDSEIVFLRRKEGLLDGIESVFTQFTTELWGLLAGVLHFLEFSLAVISYVGNEGRQRGGNNAGSAAQREREWGPFFPALGKFTRIYWNQLHNLGSLLFGQLPSPPTEDTPSRMIYILFKAFAFGLGAFYTALLVTQFQRKEQDKLVSLKKICNEPQREGKSLKDLHVAKNTSFQAYVLTFLRENQGKDFCPNIEDGDLLLFDDTVPGGGDNLCDTIKECRERVLNGTAYVTLGDGATADWLLSHGLCKSMEKVGRTGSPTSTTWVLPLDEKYNELSQTLSNAILLSRDDGSFDEITETVIDKGGCVKEDLERVDIKNVIGFLLPMGVMWLLALIIQIFKWCNCWIWPCSSQSTTNAANVGNDSSSTAASAGAGTPTERPNNTNPIAAAPDDIRLRRVDDISGPVLVAPGLVRSLQSTRVEGTLGS